MIEDEEPKPPQPRLARPPLGAWSVAELSSYIAELQEEATRAKAAIAAKQGHRAAADAFFRPK